MNLYTGHIVDVVKEEIYDGRIYVEKGHIQKIERCNLNDKDAGYIMPGFIDSHIHIESTLMLPENFARVASTHGTIAAITDPHEITNVLGEDGINLMISSSKKCNFHFFFGIPSCVPGTKYETARGIISAHDVKRLISRKEFYGLAEMMDFPGVISDNPSNMEKIKFTLDEGKVVDGHVPGLSGDALRKYAKAGITTDHETYDYDNAVEKISLGMKIQIREGSAAKNFDILFPLLLHDEYKGMLMFCTDDIYPDELLLGHINKLVVKSIAGGASLWNVLYAACVTPRNHYHTETGLLQEGDNADFIIVDNLKDFNVQKTVINGMESNEKYQQLNNQWPNCFNAAPLKPEDLAVSVSAGKQIRVITATDGQLLTGEKKIQPKESNGKIACDIQHDILKIVVYNRYEQTAPSIGFINGFNLKRGAIASTIAHDCHNIIAIGTDDREITDAINTLIESKGGISLAENGDIVQLPLPIAGLMSPCTAEEISEKFILLKKRCESLGCTMKAPFMTLSFMALPVIPVLKITDKCLFDVSSFSPTSLFVQ